MHHSFWKKQSAWIVYRISLTTWTSFTFSGIRRISRAFYRLLGCISWRARAWLWHFQSLIAQIKLWVFSTFTNESGLKTNFYPHRQHFIWVHPIIHFDLILSNTLPKWLLTGMTSQVQSNRIVWKINSKTSGTLVQPRKMLATWPLWFSWNLWRINLNAFAVYKLLTLAILLNFIDSPRIVHILFSGLYQCGHDLSNFCWSWYCPQRLHAILENGWFIDFAVRFPLCLCFVYVWDISIFV